MNDLIKKKGLVVGLTLVALMLVLTGCGEKKQSKGENTAVLVNGTAISREALDQRSELLVAQLSASMGVDLNSPGHQEVMAKIREQALEQLIQEELFAQAAQHEKLKVSAAQVDELVRERRGGLNDQEYQESLQDLGLDEAAFRDILHNQLVAEILYNKVTSEITASAQEVTDYYATNKDSLRELQVSHILIKAESKEQAALDTARQAAEGLIERLAQGADFAQLAREYSEDPGSKASGGLMDIYFTRQDSPFVEEFTEAAFTLTAGEYSREPVQTTFGFHIIRVEDQRDALEELRGHVESQLLMRKKNDAFNHYVENMQNSAAIEKL